MAGGLLIEASPANFDLLRRSSRQAQKLHSAICPWAPGNTSGTVDFTLTGGGVAGQPDIFPVGFAETFRTGLSEKEATVQVPCKPMSAVLSDHGLLAPDFLSLDVEGAEEIVLSTVDPSVFKVIAIEWSGDAKRLRRIHNRLQGAGLRWERTPNVGKLTGNRLYLRVDAFDGLGQAAQSTVVHSDHKRWSPVLTPNSATRHRHQTNMSRVSTRQVQSRHPVG